MPRFRNFSDQSAETAPLFQPPRPGGDRARFHAEPVPAPQPAFACDEPLAEHQAQGNSLGVRRRDHADLAEPAVKALRRADEGGERFRPLRQRRVAFAGLARPPEGGRVGIERRVEVVAERGGKRLFVAGRHLDGIDQRREAAGALRIEQLRERAGLRLQRRKPALRRFARGARLLLAPARCRERGLGFLRLLLPLGQRGFGFAGGAASRVQIRVAAMLGIDPLALLQHGLPLVLEPPQLRLRLAHGALALGALGGGGGQRTGDGGKLRFARGDRGGGVFRRPARLRDKLRRFRGFLAEPRFLVIEPRIGGSRVAPDLDLVLKIGGRLAAPRNQLLTPRLELRFLACKLVRGVPQPLQGGSGQRGLLAQSRQQRGRGRFAFRQFLLRDLGGGERSPGIAQLRLGLGQARKRRLPIDGVERRLELADVAGNLAVADRLPRLPAQPLQIDADLAHHVVEAGEVLLGGLQLLLRLVAAGMQARNAGRVLEDAAALLRLRRDDLGNLPLPHQRGGMRPGGGVGEQDLHVAGARLAAVDAVAGTGIALDAAGDLQRLRAGAPALVALGHQRDLGHVARRAAGGAGEDHVLHAAAAHGLVGAFAHDEAERLDQVRLAAAVRPDNAGHAPLDRDIDGVDEGLEAVQAKLRYFQSRSPSTPAGAGARKR